MFSIYKVIVITSICVSIAALSLYSIAFAAKKAKEELVFMAFAFVLVALVVVSLIVLGVKYV